MLNYDDCDTVDMFGGPGGWDYAATVGLDLRPLAIELDAAACQTRSAAGLRTIHDDVRNYNAKDFPNATGLIASPPCPTFSMGGLGAGRLAMDAVLGGVRALGHREHLDYKVIADEMTSLVLEPLRWIMEAHDWDRPFQWIALEQVPPVLPIWEAYAEVLAELGYTVATGNLQAEQYGAPQTRKRAILVARLDGPASLPTPTHSRFHSKSPERLDADVTKWVSMADALSWGMTHRPYLTVAAGTAAGGADPQMIGGSGARRTIATEREEGRWLEKAWHGTDLVGFLRRADRDDVITIDGVDYRARDLRRGDQPAFVLTEKARSWSRFPEANAPASESKYDAVRLSIEEAGVLQTFPADYPWQGSRTKQFQQVGNAIPPVLARAVLDAVVPAR